LPAADSTKPRSTDPHVQLGERPRPLDSSESRFGRHSPELERQNASGDELLRYGRADVHLESLVKILEALAYGKTRIPEGWLFFGQFIAHDMTHDRSPLQDTEDVSALQNFRKPCLDLET
jgi:hypothetical protein